MASGGNFKALIVDELEMAEMVVLEVLQVASNLELQEGRIQDATTKSMPLLYSLEQRRTQEDFSLVVLITE
ncbi:uncharacterized protein DS421_17g578050 [Arachis hypogaea]|nr:uncharacterized protein DS421_17g578050 [Arachis hypogaea]